MPAQLPKPPRRKLLTNFSQHYLVVKNPSSTLSGPAASSLPDAPLPGPVGQDSIEPQAATETILQRRTAITVERSDMRFGIKRKAVPITRAVPSVPNRPNTPDSSATFVSDSTAIPSSSDEGPEHDDDWIDIPDDVPGGARIDPEDVRPRKRAKAYLRRDDPLEAFIPERNTILHEMLRHDGLRDIEVDEAGFPKCARCQTEEGSVRCTECVDPYLYCDDCVVETHMRIPLHRVQIWNGMFFSSYSLERAGLIVQLGHDGNACPHSNPQDSLLTVLDTSGVHHIRYALCSCERTGASTSLVQLMRAQWWPATVSRPRTVVTFRTLRFFHALAAQGKVNPYDYYNGLMRVTDGTGVLVMKTSYKAFIRCVRVYRHLRMAKRAGRGHDVEGIERTRPGELALACPACPIPDVNLPDDWKNVGPEHRFLYRLFIAIDANFKLKMKERHSHSILLSDGWAFFVPDRLYTAHLARNSGEEDESKHCDSEHNALRNANMPGSKRFAINGVGATVCARHLMFRAQGIVDLSLGERYLSMDYAVFNMLATTARKVKDIVLSYDIACAWSVNFFNRLDNIYGDIYKLPDDTRLTFVIPKFHLEAHGERCKCAFNLNHTYGVGRTCGEGIEANWADLNPIAPSIREMSLTHRHEVIDDFLQAINYRKTKSLCKSLLKSLKEAMLMAKSQTQRFLAFQKTIPQYIVNDWECRIHEWDVLKDKKNAVSPYRDQVNIQSVAEVKLELAKEEAEELAKGIFLNEMMASTYISSVIALEDQKYLLDLKAKKKYPTPQDQASLQLKRNQLHVRMQALEGVQGSYIHGVEGLQACILDSDYIPTCPQPLSSMYQVSNRTKLKTQASNPELGRASLWLPSNIPPPMAKDVCVSGLRGKEMKFRFAMAMDALSNIRRTLRTRHAFYLSNRKEGHQSQRNRTRTETTRRSLTDTLNRHVAKYRRAFDALKALDPDRTFNNGAWATQFQDLEPSDLRAPADDENAQVEEPDSDEDECEENGMSLGSRSLRVRGKQARQKKTSEGRKEMSWIWCVGKVDAREFPGVMADTSEKDVYEYVRIDWARARSRAHRWREECTLLVEEMRRTVVTHTARADEWVERAKVSLEVPEDVARGIRAFAYRQANVWSSHAIQCMQEWIPFFEKSNITIAWPDQLRRHAEVASSVQSNSNEEANSKISDIDRTADGDMITKEDTEDIEDKDSDSDCDNGPRFAYLTSDEEL